jgi:sn1-specific diacylglycerol lipase
MEGKLVSLSMRNTEHAKPFGIVVDHSKRSVVVAIRGSLSIEDVITDLQVEASPLKRLGEKFGFDGTDRYAHRFILGS